MWLAPGSVPAANLDKLDASLKLIPADAAFYGSMLRNREKIEAILHSKAWAKIMEMPIVQEWDRQIQGAIGHHRQQGGGTRRRAEEPRGAEDSRPAGRHGLGRGLSVRRQDFVDFVQLFQAVNAAQSYGPMVAQITGQTQDRDPKQIQAGAVMSALVHNLKLIGVPNLVLGFKLKNTDLAKEELIKLEMFANVMLERPSGPRAISRKPRSAVTSISC